MNFFKSFSITFTSTLLLTVFGIINNIIITRQIGVDGRGQYSVILNFVLLLSLLLGEGIRRSNTILVGRNRNYLVDLLTKTSLFSFLLLFVLLLLALYSNLFTSVIPNIPNELIIIAVVSGTFYIFWQAIQSILLGIQNIVFFNILQLSPIFFNLFLNLIGIFVFDFGLTGIIYVYVVSTIITAIIAIVGIKQPLKDSGTIINKVAYSKILSLGGRSIISGIFSFMILRGGIFFSNYFLDTKLTGLYSIALIFFEILQKLPNTIGTLVLSRTVGDFSSTNESNTARLVRVMLIIDLIFIIGLLLFGRIVIVLAFGSDFAASMELIRYLIPAFLFIGPASVLYAFFMGKGYPKKIILLNGFVFIITVVFLFLFTANYGIVIVTVITSLAISIWAISLMSFFSLETNIPFNQLLFLTKADIQYIISGTQSLLRKK